MKLAFDANALCAVERALRRPFVEIIAELESANGAALSTLRALLAAGTACARFPNWPVHLDEQAAGKSIDEHGVEAVAAAVGGALREYFDKVKGANV